jgi:aspartyl-tRNA(Asn)/glutamyl-tRNA(Gln) amidotransferase subunit C
MSEKIITKKDVEYVAKLARIAISDEEAGKMEGQLERILGHIGKLREKNTANVQPTAHPLDVANVWREDEAKPFPNIPALFKNAPETEETFYKVKKVIE